MQIIALINQKGRVGKNTPKKKELKQLWRVRQEN